MEPQELLNYLYKNADSYYGYRGEIANNWQDVEHGGHFHTYDPPVYVPGRLYRFDDIMLKLKDCDGNYDIAEFDNGEQRAYEHALTLQELWKSMVQNALRDKKPEVCIMKVTANESLFTEALLGLCFEWLSGTLHEAYLRITKATDVGEPTIKSIGLILHNMPNKVQF